MQQFSESHFHLSNTVIHNVKFLNFQTPENFAVNYLKFNHRGQILENLSQRCKWNSKHWRPWSDCSSRSSLLWVCNVCTDWSVRKFRIITVGYLTIHFLLFTSRTAFMRYPLVVMMPRHLMRAEYRRIHCGSQPSPSFSVLLDLITSCNLSAGSKAKKRYI